MAVTQEQLRHAAVYDPVKRHEYYLRTRQLQGRKPGSKFDTSGSGRPAKQFVVARPGPDLNSAQAQRRKEIHARVVALTKKLEHLHEVLQQLVAVAKRNSGVQPSTNKTTTTKKVSTSSTKDAPTKKLTTTQKREAADRSKEYYKKNLKGDPKFSQAQKEKRLKVEIHQVEQQIIRARHRIATAVEKARNDVNNTKPAASKSRNL